MRNGPFRTRVVAAACVAGVLLLAATCLGEDASQKAAKDDFAGKTVKDHVFGMDLIRARSANAPKVGQPAPDFTLKTSDGTQTVTLSSFRGKRPVVLIFGSFT